MISVIKTAFASIWRKKLTSFLTVLGVVIGVTAVSSLISVGQGLKNDVGSLIQGLGTNVLVVISGSIDTSDAQSMSQTNPANFMTDDILTLEDIDSIEAVDEVQAVTPLSVVSGQIKYGTKTDAPMIVGVSSNILTTMQVVEIDRGEGFDTNSTPNGIILGYDTTQELFGDSDPIGQKVTVGTEEFQVIGTMKESTSSASFASEFNNLAAIPLSKATEMNNGETTILRILIKAKDDADVPSVKQTIEDKLLANHGGEEDFTVMTQDDVLDLFSQFLNMATTLVSAIAAISIIVGGIGIMNIMLVTVTERTREIGIRKAIGATNLAIMFQFLVEAIIITMLGGIFGVLLTYGIAWGVRTQTTLKPAITLDVLWLAVGLSIVVGVIFGLMPAMRAARKNPIEALRYE